jgi:hypothetical protein
MFAGDLRGEFHRREGLQQREEGPAKEPGLLAGDDGDGARIGQPCGRRARGRRCAAALLLRAKDTGQSRRGGRSAGR